MMNAAIGAIKHKHAFVGSDQAGDACIYVMHIDEDGTTGDYFSAELLQVVADRINDSRIGAALGALRKVRKGWQKGTPRGKKEPTK